MHEPARSISDRISLRPVIRPDDDEFLERLYFSVRDDLHGVFPDPEQMKQLLSIQLRAQMTSYDQEFPNATHEIVLLDGRRVGRLIVDRGKDNVRLVDISLLPESRDRGFGTAVITSLIEETTALGVPLLLQVLRTNKARSLYERLGFRAADDDGDPRLSMWRES